MANFFHDSESKNIQNVLSWGSVAYLAGFFTVMVHTARLGIPIIEILKPIYVWVGLPIAVVVFSIRWLWKLASARADRIKQRFEALKKETKEILDNTQNKEIDELVDVFISFVYATFMLYPPLLDSLFSKIVKSSENRLRKLIKWAIQWDFRKIDSRNSHKNSRTKYVNVNFKLLKGSEIALRTLSEVLRAISFLALLSLIPLACFYYVYETYPIIPQSYGGGAPLSATLILSADDLPLESSDICVLFDNSNCPPQLSKSVTTTKLKILYITSEQYYIQAPNDQIFSLAKNLVKGIIYDGTR